MSKELTDDPTLPYEFYYFCTFPDCEMRDIRYRAAFPTVHLDLVMELLPK